MSKITKSEPLVTRATITSLVAAVVALLVAFGLDVPTDVQNAVIGILVVAAPLVVAAVTRHRVTPVDE